MFASKPFGIAVVPDENAVFAGLLPYSFSFEDPAWLGSEAHVRIDADSKAVVTGCMADGVPIS